MVAVPALMLERTKARRKNTNLVAVPGLLFLEGGTQTNYSLYSPDLRWSSRDLKWFRGPAWEVAPTSACSMHPHRGDILLLRLELGLRNLVSATM